MVQEEGEVIATVDGLVQQLDPSSPPPSHAPTEIVPPSPPSSIHPALPAPGSPNPVPSADDDFGNPSPGAGPSSAFPAKAFQHSYVVVTVGEAACSSESAGVKNPLTWLMSHFLEMQMDVRSGRSNGPWVMADDSILNQAIVKDMQNAFLGKIIRVRMFLAAHCIDARYKALICLHATAGEADFPIVCFADGSGHFTCFDPTCPQHIRYTPSGLAQHCMTKKHCTADAGKDVAFCFVQVRSQEIRIFACNKHAHIGQRALQPLTIKDNTFVFTSDQKELLPCIQPSPAKAAKRTHKEASR